MTRSPRFLVLSFLSFAILFLNLSQIGAQSAGAGAPPSPATAEQEKTAPSGPATVLKVKTRLVIVDVVARNNKGDAVTDLKAEDFTLTEDGRPQAIRLFSLQHPTSESPRPEIPPAAGNVVDNLPRYRANGGWNVLLLDALNSNLPDQAYMRDEMVRFINKLPPDQPIAIYLLGSKLRLVQDFTSDPALLKQALASIKSQSSIVLSNPAGTQPETFLPTGSIANSVLASVPGLRSQILAFQEEHSASQTDFQVRYTLNALNSLARTLAGLPGRKNLMWISENFPFSILSTRNTNNRDYSNEVAATGSLLSDAQISVYPIDARGLLNRSVSSVGTDPAPMAGMSVTKTRLDGDMGQSMNAEADALLAAHSTMNDLADKTGGKAFYNRNDLDVAVRDSINDGSTYYTLAYYPDNKEWDGNFRKIHVKVVRSGVKLRYRFGYFAVDRGTFFKASQARQDEELDQALSLEWPAATAIPFQARVLGPSAGTQNRIAIHYRIDPHALNLEEGSDSLRHVAVLCAVRAFSVKDLDKPVKAEANKFEGPMRPEAYDKVMRGFFPCQEEIDLPPGDYFLRLGVRDNSTGLIGTATAQVKVPPAITAENATKPEEKKP